MGAWYKEFYRTTAEGRKEMLAALSDPENGAENRKDIERRLKEMDVIHHQRCVISKEQCVFIRGVLNEHDSHKPS